jgi:transposase
MGMKRYRPEEIITKLREAEVLLAQGMKVPEVAKAIGIHEITYYRWRKEYGGLKVSQAKRLKELEPGFPKWTSRSGIMNHASTV